jgi:fimbrial isopeptide formation D2 family protein/MYXO-CTERM domain-containing protein
MTDRSRTFLRSLTSLSLLVGAVTTVTPASAADPVLRHQEDLHGDVVSIGSTFAFDCDSGVPAPAGTTTDCATQTNPHDSAVDLFWRDDKASLSVKPTDARTSATLALPANAQITYARLYWGALIDKPDADKSVVFDRPNAKTITVMADQSWVLPYGFAAHPDWNYYQASADVTAFVQKLGPGAFRLTDVDAYNFVGQDTDRAFSAWSLVVFYSQKGAELRNLALFDGFNRIDPDPNLNTAVAKVTLNGFLVPPGWSAKMTAFAYEGDKVYTGDHFTLNGTQLTDAQNPADNFFNSSRSYLGAPVSGADDVPKLSGVAGSMAGYDNDTVDVTKLLKAGDTSCVVAADSAKDIFFLGGFVTSVTNLAPNFEVTKTVTDVNGGAVQHGDVLEYEITATNDGNDASIQTVLTDQLDPGLQYVPGSIQVVQGGNVGKKTDAAGDDEAEYDAGSSTITVRLGDQASAFDGGEVDIGGTVVVRFRAKVMAESGSVQNAAVLSAAGKAGAPAKEYQSDGDPNAVGNQPTVISIDECATDAECGGNKPHCDQNLHVCVPCKTDADCSDKLHPACQPSGACGECSDSNEKLCLPKNEFCDSSQGICVVCTTGKGGDASKCKDDPAGPVCVNGKDGENHCGCTADSDCGDAKSGKVCDSIPETCKDGCRGNGGNGCPDGFTCTSKDTTIGTCEPNGAGGAGGGTDTGTGTGTGGAKGGLGANPVSNDGQIGEGGGCGCSVPGESHDDGPLAALGAMVSALVVAARRRRDRK